MAVAAAVLPLGLRSAASRRRTLRGGALQQPLRIRGFGFVKYATVEEADKGINGMDGKNLDGWVICAEYAKLGESPESQQAVCSTPPHGYEYAGDEHSDMAYEYYGDEHSDMAYEYSGDEHCDKAAATVARSGSNRCSLSLPSFHCLEPCNNLFISGLSKRTTSEGLEEAFAIFGKVIEARVITNKITGYPRGFGFVKYATVEAADKGINGMDGKVLDGWVISAECAESPESHGYEYSEDEYSD